MPYVTSAVLLPCSVYFLNMCSALWVRVYGCRSTVDGVFKPPTLFVLGIVGLEFQAQAFHLALVFRVAVWGVGVGLPILRV